MMQHDPDRPEDLQTDSDDHVLDGSPTMIAAGDRHQNEFERSNESKDWSNNPVLPAAAVLEVVATAPSYPAMRLSACG
jgi:hypothetical protein